MPTHLGKDHLDLYLLLLPDIGVIVADSVYYSQHKQAIDEVARIERFHCITIPNTPAKIFWQPAMKSYPTNSLEMINNEGTLLVFTSKPFRQSPLVDALSRYPVRVIEIPFARHNASHGSIRCKTNFALIDFTDSDFE